MLKIKSSEGEADSWRSTQFRRAPR